MQIYSDEAIIQGILKSEREILIYIYKKYYPSVRHFIIMSKGQPSDVKDVFQDALIIIYKKILDGSFHLQSSFQTFLFGVCRKIWLHYLRDKRKEELVDVDEEASIIDIPDEIIEIPEEDEKKKIFYRNILKLSPTCQEVLLMTLKKEKLKEINDPHFFLQHDSFRKRRYDCIIMLIEIIKKDLQYKKLKKLGLI